MGGRLCGAATEAAGEQPLPSQNWISHDRRDTAPESGYLKIMDAADKTQLPHKAARFFVLGISFGKQNRSAGNGHTRRRGPRVWRS